MVVDGSRCRDPQALGREEAEIEHLHQVSLSPGSTENPVEEGRKNCRSLRSQDTIKTLPTELTKKLKGAHRD